MMDYIYKELRVDKAVVEISEFDLDDYMFREARSSLMSEIQYDQLGYFSKTKLVQPSGDVFYRVAWYPVHPKDLT